MNDNPFQIPPPPPGTPTVVAKPATTEPKPVLGIPAVPVTPTVSGDSATHRLSGLPRRLPTAPPAVPVARPAMQAPTAPLGTVPRTWQLSFADGQQLTLSGVLLIGRNPATRAPWPAARTVAVVDPQKTVSKTHAAFELTADGFRVHDLDSTNGVIVRSDHGEQVVPPGHPQLIQTRAEVSLGEFIIHVALD
ncbi:MULTISPECIES: FHA domain-containing protein [unclassified Diaminobutyricimonas]|uniref:FHA domain-containing protein n=1 Tax=unclassified Diaminobutyricimonas TaxID=2643261 RepID=UPI0012F482D2|nr:MULTISPECIES: FHA domain-containing protein [unclassified Diaminobutyricimonas]